jgi:hypothetical protein
MIVSCGVLYTFIRGFGGFGAVKGKVSAAERTQFLFDHHGHEGHRTNILC